MLPATKAQPKELLTVVDKPVIQYNVEEAAASGLRQIILVTAAGKSALEDHFDVSVELERRLEQKGDTRALEAVRALAGLVQISSIRQKQPFGLGHAVLAAKSLVGDEPFAVFLPDDIMHSPGDPVMAQLLRVFRQRPGAVLATGRAPREDAGKYGMLAVKPLGPRLYQVTDLVEKPTPGQAPSDLAIMGRYVLIPEVFAALERTAPGVGGEVQLTDGIKLLMEHHPVYAYEYEGRRYDCGSKLGYLRATVELALAHPDLGRTFRQYLEELLAEGGAMQAPHSPGGAVMAVAANAS